MQRYIDRLSFEFKIKPNHTENVIKLIASSGYSNIPVFKGDDLEGVANGRKLLDYFGQHLIMGGKADAFLKQTVESMIMSLNDSSYYVVKDPSITVEDALKVFHDNSRMLAILITKTGSEREKPIGIITSADVLKMNKILEDY